jgi:hypothetical protein
MVVQSLGEYYTLAGAGKELGLSYGQVWRMVQEQRVPTLTLGRTLLVKLDDLRAALAAAKEMAGETPTRPLPAAPLSSPGFRVQPAPCPECASRAVVSQEGCRKCLACGWSTC